MGWKEQDGTVHPIDPILYCLVSTWSLEGLALGLKSECQTLYRDVKTFPQSCFGNNFKFCVQEYVKPSSFPQPMRVLVSGEHTLVTSEITMIIIVRP